MSDVQPPQSLFNVTADDFKNSNWQDGIAAMQGKECTDYRETFRAAMSEREQQNDAPGKRVFDFLYRAVSLHADFDAKGNPYREWMNLLDGRRSFNTDDLVPVDFAALRGILPDIKNPEIRARVGDILWECTKDFKAALTAVTAFIESGAALKANGEFFPAIARLERAAQISARKGFEKAEADVVIAVEAYIAEFAQSHPLEFQCRRLMEILQRLGAGDRSRYAALAQQLATDAAKKPDWHAAEGYWQLAADWHRRAGDADAVKRCRVSAAECNVSSAEANVAGLNPDYFFASFWLGHGLEALRQAGADPARVAAVHKRFLEVQKKSVGAMGAIAPDADAIPGLKENRERTQDAATKHVQGHSFEVALARLAYVTRPTDTAALEAQVVKNSSETIFDKLITQAALDRTGKAADIMPTSEIGKPDTPEVLRKKMTQLASTVHWPMQVEWKIEPARWAFQREHAVRKANLKFLVVNNPFIPPGHEGIYLRGIQAGFNGDWLEAMHLLVLQFEASLRHVFQQAGAVTSTLDSDGTQKEKDINVLLWMPEMEKIFGPGIAFDLRGILIERFGHNMRNDLAHALMSEGSFYQPAAVYLWWLALHLCWYGYSLTTSAQESPPS